jgi:hypothetical protein
LVQGFPGSYHVYYGSYDAFHNQVS